MHDTAVAEGAAAALRTGRGRSLLVASVLAPAAGAHRLSFTTYRSDSDLPWSSLGVGLAGTNGTPQLTGFGTLRAGEPFDVSLVSARGNALAVTGLGVDVAMLPLLGGVLVPQPLLVIDHATDAAGSSLLRTVFPAGLSGVHLYVQSWVLDPAAVQGVAATAGLHGIAP